MRKSISGVLTSLVFLPALLLGCSGEEAPGSTVASPTFHRDVEPLLQEHCWSSSRTSAPSSRSARGW